MATTGNNSIRTIETNMTRPSGNAQAAAALIAATRTRGPYQSIRVKPEPLNAAAAARRRAGA